MFERVFIFLLVMFFRCGICNVVKRSTSCRGNVCEFQWIIDYKFTMMWYNETSEGTVYQPIVQDSKGFIRRRSTSPNCSETHEAVSLDGSDNSNIHNIILQFLYNMNINAWCTSNVIILNIYCWVLNLA